MAPRYGPRRQTGDSRKGFGAAAFQAGLSTPSAASGRNARSPRLRVLTACGAFLLAAVSAILFSGCDAIPAALPIPIKFGKSSGKKISWKSAPVALPASGLPVVNLPGRQDFSGKLTFFAEPSDGTDRGGFRFAAGDGPIVTFPGAWKHRLVDLQEVRWPDGETWILYTWDCQDAEGIKIRTLSLFDPRKRELVAWELGFSPSPTRAHANLVTRENGFQGIAPPSDAAMETDCRDAVSPRQVSLHQHSLEQSAPASSTAWYVPYSWILALGAPPASSPRTASFPASSSAPSSLTASASASSSDVAPGFASAPALASLPAEFTARTWVRCDVPDPWWAKGAISTVRCRLSWKLVLPKYRKYREFLDSIKAGYADPRGWGFPTAGLNLARSRACATATFAFDREPPYADVLGTLTDEER